MKENGLAYAWANIFDDQPVGIQMHKSHLVLNLNALCALAWTSWPLHN